MVTATTDVMDKFGIHAVSAPAGYGTADYVNKSVFRRFYFKNVRVTFDLSPERQVVAVPLDRTESLDVPGEIAIEVAGPIGRARNLSLLNVNERKLICVC